MEALTRGRDMRNYPKVLADGGCLGMVQSYGNVVVPVRKRQDEEFTPAEKEFDRLLSQDRSVVERLFGRQALLGDCERTIRSERSSLDVLVKMSCPDELEG